ncbi:PadR family transcriptional regulator [Natronobiforma cellulositropha]|uniref:PadR family transcriptional regulator n=1 Tax=Natronobiforma cellulositropha TaxID=1679076 RepID=UPI003CCD1247
MEILRRLAEEPSHGYQLHKDVGVSTPVVYRHLNDLEEEGMAVSSVIEDDNRDKTEYRITEKGRQLLELLTDED